METVTHAGVSETVARPPVAPELDEDGRDSGYGGWFCVRTAPFPCPADGCGFVAEFLTASHLVLVWPAADDRALLTAARDARDLGRSPRVVGYEDEFGKALSYDAWVQAGRPVHGSRAGPDGWDDRWERL